MDKVYKHYYTEIILKPERFFETAKREYKIIREEIDSTELNTIVNELVEVRGLRGLRIKKGKYENLDIIQFERF